MNAADVRIDDVALHLGRRPAIDGVTARAAGGITVVLGANGAGKTTLLRCLATVLAPDRGSIRIDGLDPTVESERIEIRRRLGYLPQDGTFSRTARCFDVLDYIAVLKEHRDDRARTQLVFDALDRVGLRDRAADRIESLSSGMSQRVALAAAILGSPRLLVLDEPAAGLDPDERLRCREILAERRTSATIILSTHLTDEAVDADTVIVLVDGRIRFAGTPDRLAARARGRTWTQTALPSPDVRAWRRLPDGRHRCVGTKPPADAEPVEPRLEDGYLLVTTRP